MFPTSVRCGGSIQSRPTAGDGEPVLESCLLTVQHSMAVGAHVSNRDYLDRIALLLDEGVPLDRIEAAIRNLTALNRERDIG